MYSSIRFNLALFLLQSRFHWKILFLCTTYKYLLKIKEHCIVNMFSKNPTKWSHAGCSGSNRSDTTRTKNTLVIVVRLQDHPHCGVRSAPAFIGKAKYFNIQMSELQSYLPIFHQFGFVLLMYLLINISSTEITIF